MWIKNGTNVKPDVKRLLNYVLIKKRIRREEIMKKG